MQTPRIKLIAHRGESHDAPENTLASVNLAWERGVRAVEVDVHLTADKEICVIHDTDTLRTTGKKLVVRKTKMGDLREFDAESWKDEKWKDERIPILAEVLSTVPSDGKIVIEIKSNDKILDILRQQTANSGLRDDQIEIISFNLKNLTQAKQMMPAHKMLWLIPARPAWCHYLSGTNAKSLIRKLSKSKLDGVNIEESKYLAKNIVTEFKSARLQVYTWTVNDHERARELIDNNVDYIITDRAAWMTEMLKR